MRKPYHQGEAIAAKSQPESLVIYGPQGCGKTLNAPTLARHYGLQEWRDWEPREAIPRRGVLLLCTDHDRTDVRRTNPEIRFVHFKDACRATGIKDPMAAVRRRA